MPPRSKLPSGLTEEDVARLRGQLGEGRRPRVALSGPQFEAGASGSVVRIGDPAVDGADFLTVRVKVNGVTDELAFAPAELNIGRGTRTAGAGTGSAGSRSAGSRSAGSRTRTVQPQAAAATSTVSKVPVASAAPAVVQATAPPPADSVSAVDRTKADSAVATSTPASQTATMPTPTARRRKAPAAPTVSVTISSSGAAWTVSASRGARTITKNVPIAPGVVTAIADLLDQPGVSEAVTEINETARRQAQQRAEELRAELSDLEAVLATHRAPR